MKQILLLIPALNAGGAERVMVTLANEWSKDNDVTIMVFNDGKCFYELSNKVHIRAMNLMPKTKGIKRLLSIPSIEIERLKCIYSEIKRGKYDFTLSFCYTTNMFAALSASIIKNKKIIVSERNDPYGYSKLIRFLINRLYRKCHTVVCQNQMVKDYFVAKKFKNNLVILPNPVNFSDIPDKRPTEIEKSIVTVGRLIEQKNHKLLIDAFSELVQEYPDYSLKIYGIGPLENEIQGFIEEKKLQNKVFLMGIKKRVMYEVSKSSIFVLPSNFEGFPNVLIEAMATGMPVISSDFKTGVARELILSEENGYLFNVGDKGQLIDCLRRMLERSEEFTTIGNNNKKIAKQYKDDIIAVRWLNCFRSISGE